MPGSQQKEKNNRKEKQEKRIREKENKRKERKEKQEKKENKRKERKEKQEKKENKRKRKTKEKKNNATIRCTHSVQKGFHVGTSGRDYRHTAPEIPTPCNESLEQLTAWNTAAQNRRACESIFEFGLTPRSNRRRRP